MNERRFDELDPFLQAVTEAGVRRLVVRSIDEHRPLPGTAHVPLDPYRRVDLLAYAGSVLYKCVLEGARPSELAAPLTEAGLEVKLVSGNIT